MWCSHCVEDQQVAWGPDYIACSVCGKLFEFPVSKSHRMIGKPKKIQEKKHKHQIDNMSSTSTKSHGQELKRKTFSSKINYKVLEYLYKEKKHKHPTNNMSSTSTKSHGQELKRKVVLATQRFCWTGQFIGHGVFKKRSPALFDNLFQAVLMAPFCLT